jgi:hypothetical protein
LEEQEKKEAAEKRASLNSQPWVCPKCGKELTAIPKATQGQTMRTILGQLQGAISKTTQEPTTKPIQRQPQGVIPKTIQQKKAILVPDFSLAIARAKRYVAPNP